LHFFGDLVRVQDARYRHLDFAFFVLSTPQLTFSFFQVQVAVVIPSKFLLIIYG
jgi:hypothetical protein